MIKQLNYLVDEYHNSPAWVINYKCVARIRVWIGNFWGKDIACARRSFEITHSLTKAA